MPKKCQNKYRFTSWRKAQEFAESYAEQVSMLFNPMRAYWCHSHEVWHIGHDLRQRIDYKNGGQIVSND